MVPPPVVMAVLVPVPAVGMRAHPVAVHPSQDGGEEEHDAVHDAKREACLEHRAGLVGLEVKVGARHGPESAEAGVPVPVLGQVRAVGVGNVAQVPHAGNEGADEAEIDEGDEAGVGRRAVVGKDCKEGPC